MSVDDIRVLIVAQNRLARVGLSALLAQQPGLEVVGQVSGEGDLSRDIALYQPDALVWDIDWESAVDLIAALGGGGPPILALVPDASYAADAWAAGASGLLLRDAEAEALYAALLAIRGRLAVFDPALAAALFPARVPAPEEDLTAREREVLQLLAEGLPNKVIAARLNISEHTVKFHVNSIMTKLGVQSRTEAVVRAVRLGIILL